MAGASTPDGNLMVWIGRIGSVLISAIIIWAASTIKTLETDVAQISSKLQFLITRPIPPPWVENRINDNREGIKDLNGWRREHEGLHHRNGQLEHEDHDLHAWKAD